GSQSGIAVSPAAVDHLLVGAPDGVTAGAPFDVRVTAQDAYNNTVTGYTGTVTFTSTDPGAALPADYTFTADDQGQHTFTAGGTLFLAGGRTVAVTDASVTAVAGSRDVTVSAAAADHLRLSGPSSAAAGTAFDLTVAVLDAYNNVVTGY